MNLLTQSFGATGKLVVNLDTTGLTISLTDSEKLSDQSLNAVIHPNQVLDGISSLLGNPSWLVSISGFIKAELAVLAAK